MLSEPGEMRKERKDANPRVELKPLSLLEAPPHHINKAPRPLALLNTHLGTRHQRQRKLVTLPQISPPRLSGDGAFGGGVYIAWVLGGFLGCSKIFSYVPGSAYQTTLAFKHMIHFMMLG